MCPNIESTACTFMYYICIVYSIVFSVSLVNSLVRRTSLSNLPKSLLYCSWVHPLTSHFIRHTILVPLSAKIWLQEFKLLKMTCWIIIVICHFYEWKTLIVINIIFIRDQTKRREEIAINDARRQRCKAEKKSKRCLQNRSFPYFI